MPVLISQGPRWGIVTWAVLSALLGAKIATAQIVLTNVEPVPSLLSARGRQPERQLAPIPSDFDWIERQVLPNPGLEDLLERRDFPQELFLSISLAETYSDNIEREPDDRQDDFETSAEFETVYWLLQPNAFISLANTIEAEIEAKSGDGEIGFANLALNAGYQWTRFSLGLSESLIRNDDFALADAQLRFSRGAFLRNRVTPQIRYQLNQSTESRLAYTHTLVLQDDEDRFDSTTHAVSVVISHRFRPRLRGLLRYAFVSDDNEGLNDTIEHRTNLGLIYGLTQQIKLSLNLLGAAAERSGERLDSTRYGATVGVRYLWSETLSIVAAMGVMALDQESLSPIYRTTWQLGIDGEWEIIPRLTLESDTRRQLINTSDEVGDAGFVMRQTFDMELDYEFDQAWELSIFADITLTDFLESDATLGQTGDEIFWQTGAKLTYDITSLWTVSLRYRYRQRTSDVAEDEFREHQATLELSAELSAL